MKNKLLAAFIVCLIGTASSGALSWELVPSGENKGPYAKTVIQKFYDKDEGVVCYIYAPRITAYEIHPNIRTREDDYFYDGNSAGSISCVKR